ncbi:MAG: gliding motility protein GldN [Bacteroidales bacterium]|nr:gliding motility protein GldN [Bacteroidales bacterium]
MKKLLFGISLFAIALSGNVVNAQDIIDADDEPNFTDYYKKENFQGRKAIPYAYLRESDVVWETAIWRSVDFREKFNQFFYFPTSITDNTQGRINIANTLMRAWENGDIEAFKDDDLKVPADFAVQTKALGEPVVSEVKVEDEDGMLVGTGDFNYDTLPYSIENIFGMKLKEFWYIEKQDTRQKVRIVALSLVYNRCVTRGGTDGAEEERTCRSYDVAWFPMNDMRVRNVLVKANAYDERNNAAQRSYDDVFIDRYFDSYVVRESNRFNRTIASYTVGEDAILLSQEIENRIFDIESDMWEY